MKSLRRAGPRLSSGEMKRSPGRSASTRGAPTAAITHRVQFHLERGELELERYEFRTRSPGGSPGNRNSRCMDGARPAAKPRLTRPQAHDDTAWGGIDVIAWAFKIALSN